MPYDRRRHSRTALVALVMLSVGLAACGAEAAETAGPPSTAAAEPSDTGSRYTGPVAEPSDTGPVDTGPVDTGPVDLASGDASVPEIMQFTASLVGGSGTFDGAAEAGRPVAFWFWAPT
ncbi:MAG: hypothetical protein WD023_09945 [Ilumatobacteraceae bacterium]